MSEKRKHQAQITVVDLEDGAQVTIEYTDGHVVRLSVGPDSQIIRKFFGAEEVEEPSSQ